MKGTNFLPFLILFLLLQTSCTQRLIDFTVISTKNFDLSRANTFERGKTRVTGEDAAYVIIIIPTGVPSLEEAVDRAIESVSGGVALVDGVLYSSFLYLVLFTESKYIIEGTPLIDPSLAAVDGKETIGQYNVCHIDKKGEVEEFKTVSEEEYMKLRRKYSKAR